MSRKWIIVLGVFIVACVLLTQLRSSPPKETPDQQADLPASMAPEVTFTNLNGPEQYLMSQWRGHYVLLNFWATWCSPCRLEFPDIVALASEFAGHQFDVIMVSVDDSRDDAQAYMGLMKQKYPDAFDKGNIFNMWDVDKQLTTDVFQTMHYPESILIDPKGKMIYKVVGQLIPEDIAFIRGTLRGESPALPSQ